MENKKPLFDANQVVKSGVSLFTKLLPPGILTVVGIVLLIYAESINSPVGYLLSFFGGSLAALIGIILCGIVIYKHMKRTAKQDRPFAHTVLRMHTDKNFRIFYWGIGILCIVDLFLAILLGSEEIIGLFSGLLIIIVVVVEQVIKHKSRKS